MDFYSEKCPKKSPHLYILKSEVIKVTYLSFLLIYSLERIAPNLGGSLLPAYPDTFYIALLWDNPNLELLVSPVRLELTTYILEGCCSIQLSYGDRKGHIFSRTYDL